MLQLKLKEPYDQVFIYLGLENPLTGETRTVDAKIDTGAAVTIVPKNFIEDFGLEVLGKRMLSMANGDTLPAYVCLCNVYLSEEDAFEMYIHVVDSSTGIALIGMDILKQCDYAQWHSKEGDNQGLFFKIELVE